MEQTVMHDTTPTVRDDREAIRDLYARYTLLLRTGAVDEWLSLFTDDPIFTGGGPTIEGRAALEDHGRVWASQRAHRMIGSHVIDVKGDLARCRASVVVYKGVSIYSVGSTDDELKRVDGTWRIHRRAFTSDA